ncbi:MAG: hypothetical protein QXN59_02640, partial [Candidatus Micrarchaeaceae archaeon]
MKDRAIYSIAVTLVIIISLIAVIAIGSAIIKENQVRPIPFVQVTSNVVSFFNEAGLPINTKWNVTYDSILNSSTSNSIKFSTAGGSYQFDVPKQIANSIYYYPTPSSGNVIAGNTTDITFSTKSFSITLDDS